MRYADRMRISTYGSIEALPAGANALFDSAPTLFESRWWWRVMEHNGLSPGTQPCWVLCENHRGPVALFPMLTAPGTRGLTGLVTPYTCHYAPLFGADIGAPERAAALAAFARFCRRFPTARLDALDAGSPIWRDCALTARAAHLVPIQFPHFGNWHEPVANTGWADYLAARSGALRETIRRKLRRTQQDSRARFELFDNPAHIEDGIGAYEAVYRRSWKEPEPFPLFNPAFMRARGHRGRAASCRPLAGSRAGRGAALGGGPRARPGAETRT